MSRRRRAHRFRGLRGDPEGDEGAGEEGKGEGLRARFSRATSEEGASAPQDDSFVKRATRYASLKPPGMEDEGRSPSPYGRRAEGWPVSPWPGGSGARPTGDTEEDRAFGTTAATGLRLARQIRDEFLVCKICLETYTRPKTLECLHTFCEQCIENHIDAEPSYRKYSDYREVICPLCRKRTTLPTGGVRKLQDSWLVSSLHAAVGRQAPSSNYPVCDVCFAVNHKQREATSKCVDCAKLLCSGCVLVHKDTSVTAGHSVFDIDIEKDIECKEHKDEVVRFYCEPCDVCICVLCTFVNHKDHDICPFSEASLKYKDSIRTLLESCDDKMKELDVKIEALGKCEDHLRQVEQVIHDTAIQYIQSIRIKEKELVEEMREMFGVECLDSFERRKDLRNMRDTLQSTSSLTNLVLSGQDVELLLLKKDIQHKLKTLTDDCSEALPPTIHKLIEFIPGSADLGHIRDLEGPSSGAAAAGTKGNGPGEKAPGKPSDNEIKSRLNSSGGSSVSLSSTSGEGSSVVEQPRVDMHDSSTQTDLMQIQSGQPREVKTEDKSINTDSVPQSPATVIRGRGGITITSGVKGAPGGATVVKHPSLDGPHPASAGESGGVEGRRQRMIRAHSAMAASGAEESAGGFTMANMTLEGRRKWRLAAMAQAHQSKAVDQTQTPMDQGHAPGDQGLAPGDQGHAPGDQGQTRQTPAAEDQGEVFYDASGET